MRIGPKTLLRLLPPALALAGLCAACLWETARIQARAQGYGGKAVVINEICAHNLSGLQDGDGVCKDWIELYNPGGEPVDLSGWSLSDDKDDPGHWVFPAGTVLQDYLVLFADGSDRQDAAGWHHTSFALRTRGETLYLYDAAGALVDKLKYPEQDFDITYGRAFGSGEDTGTFATATPGAANPADFLQQEREAPLGTAEFSLPAGFYDDTIELTLQADDPEALIFYTTDGSDPAENGTLYTGPLRIESRAGEPNEYVSLANRFADGPSEFIKNYAYRYAPDPVDKATTVTVRLYKDGCWSDEAAAATYWVGVQPHTLPVVSITADAADLFGPAGIYVPGATYYTMLQRGNVSYQANFFSGEDIDAWVQLPGQGGMTALQADVSVGGQASRRDRQMKNLSVDPKDGSADEVFSLKGPGNGSWDYFYVDGFWNNYLYDKGVGTQRYEPVVLYLQDEYWGIYCLRDRKNEEFLARRYGVEADSVTICATVHPDEAYSTAVLYKELEALPDGAEGWAWLNATFDIGSFIDYVIPQMYSSNWDGLRIISNIFIWKAEDGDSAYADGRWRFLLNDMDQTMVYEFMDPINDLLATEDTDGNLQKLLFQKLWGYEEFRTRFAEKFRAELATTYAPETILPAFAAWCERLKPEMERNFARQAVELTPLAPLADRLAGQTSEAHRMTMEQWEADYQTLCQFFEVRADYLLGFLADNLQQAGDTPENEREAQP